jgi:hypothetical protein
MSWVEKSFRQEQEQRGPAEQEARASVDQLVANPRWKPTWERICDDIRNSLSEFNEARGAQFQPSWGDLRIQVIPKQEPFDTAILEIDEQTGTMALTCPINHPGTPRRGTFKISEGLIASKGDSVGEPRPPDHGMTPEEFSEFILKPLLFPRLI